MGSGTLAVDRPFGVAVSVANSDGETTVVRPYNVDDVTWLTLYA